MIIHVEYIGATNTRGARYRASGELGAVSVPVDHSADDHTNRLHALRAYTKKYGVPPYTYQWEQEVGGSYIFVAIAEWRQMHA